MISAADEAAKVDLSAKNTPKVNGAGGGRDKVSYTPSDGSKPYTPGEKSYGLQATTTANGTKYYKLNDKWYKSKDVTYLSGGIAKIGSVYSIKNGAKDYGSNVAYDKNNNIILAGNLKTGITFSLYDFKGRKQREMNTSDPQV